MERPSAEQRSNDKGFTREPRAPRLGYSFRLLRGVLQIEADARREELCAGFAQPLSPKRIAAGTIRVLWNAVRWVTPRVLWTKVRDWFLRQGQPKPVRKARNFFATGSSPNRWKDFGINIVGYMRSENGLGEAARGIARAAAHAGIHTALIDVSDCVLSRMAEDPPPAAASEARYDVNLIHVQPPEMITPLFALGNRLRSKAYNIGYWFWETTDFPDTWIPAFDMVHELWVASSFCLEVFSRKSPVPVIRIPLCVEPIPAATLSREHFRLPPTGFLFLSMCDFFSTPERKNPMGAIEAFQRAFASRSEGAYLVLKVSNSGHRPEMQRLLRRMVKDDPTIILIDGYLNRPKLNALISCCDCLVSLHRSEGFGLPMAEAMYFGRPSIATGWSGNRDFMTMDNSLLVRYSLIPVSAGKGPYADYEGFWADPDLDHAAHLMRKLAGDSSLAGELALAAQRTIRDDFSAAAVGELMRNRLAFIRKYLGP
ncbi:MAG: glycosyltransferase family 4 protein [Desulfomonilaceae bacterium]